MVLREGRLRAARARRADPGAVVERDVTVEPPYRLDLTVDVLRRFSTNVVDVREPGGEYARALGTGPAAIVVRVRQSAQDRLTVALDGDPARMPEALALVRRVLGTERRTPEFDAGAARIPWLRDLARRMRGVRAPRYPTLWEACVNAVVFQQISLHAASAILRRAVTALAAPVPGAMNLRVFPGTASWLRASDDALRGAGLSGAKIETLLRIAGLLESGVLDEAMLEARPSPAAAALLCEIKGIGAWTATVILLRGLGRLDVFPANDSGVARGLVALAGGPVDLGSALSILGSQRGMLYYHLLLARLEASGAIEPGAALPSEKPGTVKLGEG